MHNEITQFLVPILTALMSGGGVWAWIKSKTDHENQRIINYYTALQARLDLLETKVETLTIELMASRQNEAVLRTKLKFHEKNCNLNLSEDSDGE